MNSRPLTVHPNRADQVAIRRLVLTWPAAATRM